MPNILKSLKRFLTYKEPTRDEGFELLENEKKIIEEEYEGNTQRAESNGENQSTQSNKSKKQVPQKPSVESLINKPKILPESNRDDIESQTGKQTVSYDLHTNLKIIENEFNMPKNQDVIIRQFKIARTIKAFIVYIEGMINPELINEFILKQLMTQQNFCDFSGRDPMEYICDNVLSINHIKSETELSNIILAVLAGKTALFVEGCPECLMIETRGFEKRAIDKPQNETVIRGSHESFTENLRTNITMIRRIVKNQDLITEMMPVGKTDHSNCAIVYIEGIVNPELLKEVKRRLKKIDVDIIIGDGIIEQYIEDSPLMLFPQVISTERPDRVASFLLEGKVILISAGVPYALAVPITFFHLFHTSEDTFLRWQFGSFLRLIRLTGLLIAIFLPGLYVALTLYRQEMIPTELLTTIAQAREAVPFPTIFEILLMEISFELIREAGIRVPGVIGQTLGIIGALILGQAAVSAGLVSPILIIIVAMTGLGSFAVPNYGMNLAVRILKFLFIILGGLAGFYGVAIGIFVIGGLMCSMKSFGVPYFAPLAPKGKASADLIIRRPIWTNEERPDAANAMNIRRQGRKARGWASDDESGDDGQ